MSWYWKEVDSQASAYDATRAAVGVSYFVSALTAVLAIVSIVYHEPALGVSPSALVDALLFGIVGWRISRLSKPWTVVGLCLYMLEAVGSIAQRGVGIGILTIVFILVYINAVRGVFAYHRFAQELAEQPVPELQSEPPTERAPIAPQ